MRAVRLEVGSRSAMNLGVLRTILISVIIFFGIFIPVKAQDKNKNITVELNNADIRSALQILFKSEGLNFSLDENVSGMVSVSLHDVPFKVALESILRSTDSSNPLTYTIENGVYFVRPKVEELKQPESMTELKKKENKYDISKILLNFSDVFDIANAFGGWVVESRFSR